MLIHIELLFDWLFLTVPSQFIVVFTFSTANTNTYAFFLLKKTDGDKAGHDLRQGPGDDGGGVGLH